MSTAARRIRVLFFESGRRGGSIFRLRSVLERADPERFEMGFVSYYSDRSASCLFELGRLFCRVSLGLRGEPPDVFKHALGLEVPMPFAIYYFMVSLLVLWRHRPAVAYMNTGIDGHQPAIWAARLLRIPVVCHIRTSRPLTRNERRHAKYVRRFVASSAWGAEQYSAQLGCAASDMDYVHDAVDVDAFDARARSGTAPALPGEQLYVCQVGSLISRKRPLLAVEAVALARQRCPALRLVLAGDGPLLDELDRLLRDPRLGPAVHVLGHVGEVPALLRRCHIGLLVSEHEGMPNAVIEYMAACLPVVVSPVPGIDELVVNGRTGLIVDPPSAERLAESLLQLALSPETREAWGRAGRRRVEEGPFRLETETRAIESVLERAAAVPATRRGLMDA
jgi:glycosyltransferase involved in cell wall biosynthesis